jgi:hypothetical protein
MTNKEKIEQFLTDNPLFTNWYYVSTIDVNLFIYYMDFIDDAEYDGIYDCSVNTDDTINYVRHIMQ